MPLYLSNRMVDACLDSSLCEIPHRRFRSSPVRIYTTSSGRHARPQFSTIHSYSRSIYPSRKHLHHVVHHLLQRRQRTSLCWHRVPRELLRLRHPARFAELRLGLSRPQLLRPTAATTTCCSLTGVVSDSSASSVSTYLCNDTSLKHGTDTLPSAILWITGPPPSRSPAIQCFRLMYFDIVCA